MSWLNTLFEKLYQMFNWFYTVVPWERAMRVRMGKYMKVMEPGIHVQIPFIDKVYLMNIRDRVNATSAQTLTTSDGVTLTLQAAYRFSVADIEPMYNRLHQAGETISCEIEGAISEYVTTHNATEVSPTSIRENVFDKIDLTAYGLNCSALFLTDFVRVKTYRLVQGALDRWHDDDTNTSRERRAK